MNKTCGGLFPFCPSYWSCSTWGDNWISPNLMSKQFGLFELVGEIISCIGYSVSYSRNYLITSHICEKWILKCEYTISITCHNFSNFKLIRLTKQITTVLNTMLLGPTLKPITTHSFYWHTQTYVPFKLGKIYLHPKYSFIVLHHYTMSLNYLREMWNQHIHIHKVEFMKAKIEVLKASNSNY